MNQPEKWVEYWNENLAPKDEKGSTDNFWNNEQVKFIGKTREVAQNELLDVLEREVKEVLPIQQLINGQLKDTGFIEKGVVLSILNQHKKH